MRINQDSTGIDNTIVKTTFPNNEYKACFPDPIIVNSTKLINSYKSPEDVNKKQTDWQLAQYVPRIKPGEGLLPPAPQLAPAISAKGSALLAAAQLMSSAGQRAVNSEAVLSETPCADFASMLACVSARASSLINSFDHSFDGAIKQLTPWQGAEARPEISIEVDNEIDDATDSVTTQDVDPTVPDYILDTQRLARKYYVTIVDRVKNNYPLLHRLASNFLKFEIFKRHGIDVDPDKTWFNRFEFSSSSSETFTGWEHNMRPHSSKTLTDVLLSNFGARDRINSDAMSGNSGIYTQNDEAESFGKQNEVRLLPKDFLKIVVDSDFSDHYLKALDFFWKKYGNDYRTVSKGKFISYMGDKSSNLSATGVTSVMMAALGDINTLPAMTMAELEKKISDRPELAVSTFSIYGYHATDIILIEGYEGKIILYKPSDLESFIEFDNHDQLKEWVLTQARDETKRTNLLHHFSLYDGQDGQTYAGVSSALTRMADGKWSDKYINYRPRKIKGDLFSWLARQAEHRTTKDSNTLTVTNDEVFREQVLMNLKPMLDAGGLATIILPGLGSLIVLELGVIEMEIGVYIAINGDTTQERAKGLSAIIDGGVNSLFGAIGFKGTVARGLETEDNVLQNAKNGPTFTHPYFKSPRPGTFMDNLMNRIVVRGRGMVGITQDSKAYGEALSSSLIKMEQTLVKAKASLATAEGSKIVSAYLGYEEIGVATKSDLTRVSANIDALSKVLKNIHNQKISLQSISIYDSRMKGVAAYFDIKKKTISFDDRFFLRDENCRMRILIHEAVHATGLEGIKGKHMPDYFYVSDANSVDDILRQRDHMLSLSAGAIDIDFLRGHDAALVKHNFITKMEADSQMQSIIAFQGNERLRKAVLLDNPDTLALLSMELAGDISETTNPDGLMRIPSGVTNFKNNKLQELKEAAEDMKYAEQQEARNAEQQEALNAEQQVARKAE